MKMSIATISLSGDLVEKLEAAASAGFAGVEVFDNDRQRAEAVRCLEAQGYTFEDGVWQPPRIGGAQPTLEGDAIHAMMVRRVETIAGRAGHEVELDCLTIAINAYESVRWRAWAMPQQRLGTRMTMLGRLSHASDDFRSERAQPEHAGGAGA